MASIEEVYNVIHVIATGIEKECTDCMADNTDIVEGLIREQLYSGQDGKGKLLKPTYDNDPFFEERGRWYHRAKQYKHWKEKITPPIQSEVLFLPPRPIEVPNLFITGKFHDSIVAKMRTKTIETTTAGFRDGPAIQKKYGNDIFRLGDAGREYFSQNILRPWLERFIKRSGYK